MSGHEQGRGEAMYKRLFSPFAMGKVTLQNRVVILPHGTSMLRDGASYRG